MAWFSYCLTILLSYTFYTTWRPPLMCCRRLQKRAPSCLCCWPLRSHVCLPRRYLQVSPSTSPASAWPPQSPLQSWVSLLFSMFCIRILPLFRWFLFMSPLVVRYSSPVTTSCVPAGRSSISHSPPPLVPVYDPTPISLLVDSHVEGLCCNP